MLLIIHIFHFSFHGLLLPVCTVIIRCSFMEFFLYLLQSRCEYLEELYLVSSTCTNLPELLKEQFKKRQSNFIGKGWATLAGVETHFRKRKYLSCLVRRIWESFSRKRIQNCKYKIRERIFWMKKQNQANYRDFTNYIPFFWDLFRQFSQNA